MVVDNFMLACWRLGLSFDVDNNTCLIHLSKKQSLRNVIVYELDV